MRPQHPHPHVAWDMSTLTMDIGTKRIRARRHTVGGQVVPVARARTIVQPSVRLWLDALPTVSAITVARQVVIVTFMTS